MVRKRPRLFVSLGHIPEHDLFITICRGSRGLDRPARGRDHRVVMIDHHSDNVLNATAGSIPVARIVTLAVVLWRNPMGCLIRRSSPVTFVPFVVISHWIPITCHPHACRIWLRGDNGDYARWRWRPNHDSNRNLCLACFRRNQQHCDQQYSSDEILQFFIGESPEVS
jgi:hypothetical protein